MRHEHPVVAVTEVQAPPAALATVLLVQVGRILVALGPLLDVPPGTVGRHGGHLSQQSGVRVNGLGTGRPSGASQGIGMLRRDVTLRQRAGHIGHPGESPGPLPAPPGLALRDTGVATQHLHGVHTSVAEGVQSIHRPRLGGVGTRTHAPQGGHQSPQHPPPGALQRQTSELSQQRLHKHLHMPNRITRTGDDHVGLVAPGAVGKVEAVRRIRLHIPNSTEGV